MALESDYDRDPGRWSSWHPTTDVHDVIGPELCGPVLDVGCGDGRLGQCLAPDVEWFGVDLSWSQLSSTSRRPVVQADMRALPFRDGAFAEVTHLWCLYHVDDPIAAIAEARRVLGVGGRYYACTSARASDPELMPEEYAPSPFDAEAAGAIVRPVFPDLVEKRWDGQLYALETREEVDAYCRSHFIPPERASQVEVPLRLTKRGVLIRAVAT